MTNSIQTRIERGKLSLTRCSGGHYSPLLSIEPGVVEIMRQMARIRACLTPSDGLRLINSSIVATTAQDNLVAWEHKYSHIRKNVDMAGSGYWQGVMKRNKHLIVSRKGQKYELNRSN